ncbi:MAG: hypothetical protein KGM49_00450 [Sphingomonadales bacterium]|nr:hypothetical protein [Sphingomonadales bacterium]
MKIGFGASIAVIIATSGCHAEPRSDANERQSIAQSFDASSAISVSAVELDEQFGSNSVDANQRYGDASIVLKGWVTSVEDARSGSDDLPRINLNTGGTSIPVAAEIVDRAMAVGLVPHDDLELHCRGASFQGYVVVHRCSGIKIVSHDRPLDNI